MKKTNKIIVIALTLCLLFATILVPVSANDNEQMDFNVNEDLYTLIETNPGALDNNVLHNFKLRESDIPFYMQNTDIRSTDSIVRLKKFEKNLSSVTYLNSDGTLSTYFFGEDVKFELNNEIIDKTNVLSYDVEKKYYYNPDNDIKLRIPMFLSNENMIDISNENYTISFIPVTTQENVIAQKCFKSEKEDYIVYDQAFGNNTKLVYNPTFSGLKEEIIITEKVNTNTFEFNINTNGLKAIKQDNCVILLDKDDNIIANINELFISDSVGNVGNGSIELEEITPFNSYLYRIIVERDFLSKDETLYPVNIDPTINYVNSTNIKDVQTVKDFPYVTHTATSATIGYNAIYGSSRFLVRFPNLETVLSGLSSPTQIVEAKYTFYCSDVTSSSSKKYYFYPQLVSWDESSSNIGTSAFSGYATSSFNSISITSTGYYTANLLNVFRYFKSCSVYNGFNMKKQDETSDYITIKTIDNTSNKPYLLLRYSEYLPTYENEDITNKSIYRVKNKNYSNYITKNATVSGTTISMSFKLESSNTTTGSTREKSQFISVNYISNGRYTLSFIMPPFNSSATDTTTGYSTNYYLKAEVSLNNSYLNYSNTISVAAEWYLVDIYESGNFYKKIINAKYPWLYLIATTENGPLTVSETVNDKTKWLFEYCGYDVPLYFQDGLNACGWACTCMILKYYNISVTEDQVRAYNNITEDLVATYINIRDTLNYYMNTQNHIYTYDTSLVSQSYLNYRVLLNSYLYIRPVIVLCKFNSNSQFGWGTNGHYIVVKGIFEIDGTYKCLINDSCKKSNGENQCRERLIDVNALRDYNDDKGGYSVHAN